MRVGELWRRILSLFLPGKREPELDQELRFHLEMQAEQNRRRGMSPSEAGRQARRDFGTAAQIKEESRESRGFPRVSEWLRDLRLSVRSLSRSPGFTAVAVLTLGLGVGATTAIFSVVEAVLLRALPFPEPNNLVVPQTTLRTGGQPWTVTALDFVAWEQAGIFDKVALYEPRSFDVAGSGTPVRTNAIDVTRDFFAVLGTTPVRGRFFVEDDFTGSGATPVVLSYGLWQRLGARNDIVGSSLKVRGVSSVVVGVARAGEEWPVGSDLWTARRTPFDESDLSSNNFIYQSIARLKPGSGLVPVNERLDLLARDRERENPVKRKDVTVIATPAHDFVVGPSLTRSLWVMLGAVAFVLLIACVNVANLLLARTTRRQAELALRAALGASRSRLTRHLLSESLLLAIPGGLFGILLAGLGVAALKQLAPPNLPGLGEAAVNPPVLIAALIATGLTVLVAGLTPALHGAGLVRAPELGETAGRTTASSSTGRLRAALVVLEVALSLTLLAGAAVLLRSFSNLEGAQSGLEVRSAVTFQAAFPRARGGGDAAVLNFWNRFLGRLEELDGVEAASAALSIPLGGGGYYVARRLMEAGKPEPPGSPEFDVFWNVVAPKYFAALGQPILEGRDFTAQDDTLSRPVIIVSQSVARALFPKGSALGQRVFSWRDERIEREIVGIVGDVRYGGQSDSLGRSVYIPLGQYAVSSLAVVVRGQGQAADLLERARNQLEAIDPEIAMASPQTMEEVRSTSIARPRFLTLLVGIFSATALVLAAVGLSGLLSYSVAQRDRELSIRIALGASRGSILGLVLRQTLILAGAGVLLGLAGALALTGVLRSLLFEVSPTDPVAFVSVGLVLVMTALLASAMPARRAVKSNPVDAMRTN